MPRLRLEVLDERALPSVLPPGFAESTLIAGLSSPTSLAVAPDGRLFVAEQDGALRVVQNGQLLATPAITLNVTSNGERGLLGVAVDPNFAGNGFIYLYFTQATGNQHRVSRFTVVGNTINPTTEFLLLTLPDSPGTSNHNGGALHFGPDGKLYIAKGDDADGNLAQSLNNLHGKILRLNADGTIPTDNPFFNTTTGMNRAIWALGLRNPFTFAFDPGIGRMIINDVGAGSFEEVDEGGAGLNYGWPATEGPFDTSKFPGFVPPIFAYPHVSGTAGGFAITGAAFYPTSGGTFPADYAGDYFFGDLTNNWIRRLDKTSNQASLFATDVPGGTVDIDVALDGSLLVTSFNTGQITRIVSNAPQAPTISTPPQPITVQRTQGATFYAVASGTAPLNYQWERDGTPIPGANQATFTLFNVQLSDNGAAFRVVVSNAAGVATSSAATLTVQNSLPPPPSAVLIGEAEFAAGLDNGNLATLFNADKSVRFTVAPYEAGFSGGVRAVAADFSGDGIADLAVASGPGRTGNVRIFDGVNQSVLFDFNPFGTAFERGINMSAGDLTGNGRAEIIMSAERGGGARIRIWSPDSDAFLQISDFFALIGGDGVPDTSFRGGARTAVGDFNGDGRGDLAFAAGSGGGPRIALFNGITLGPTGGQKLRGDFFAFDSSLRDGASVAAGDFDGDGRAELFAGAGNGGGPRASIFLSTALLNNLDVRLRDFFAGNAAGRAGVRLAVKNLDGDARADLVTAADTDAVTAYAAAGLLPGAVTPLFAFDPFAPIGGAFVG